MREMSSGDGSKVVFAIGFNKFSQIGAGNGAIFVPCKTSSRPPFAKSVITASWDSTLFLNDDGSLTVRGFLNGLSGQEKILRDPIFSSIKSARLVEERLYVISGEGKLKVFDLRSWKEDDNVLANSKIMPRLKCIDAFGTAEEYPSLYAVTETNEFYSIDKDLIPTWIPLLLKVTKISCGISHGILLAENGTVYTWGNGSRGQLGHGCLQDEKKPKLVEILCGVTITSVSAGGWHSVALADTGDIYVWGWNDSGQLGFSTTQDFHTRSTKPVNPASLSNTEAEPVAMLNVPTLLELEHHLHCEDYIVVTDLSCGTRHTAVVTKNGMAVTWGWGKYGQLGQHCCLTDKPAACHGDRSSEEGAKRRRGATSVVGLSLGCGGKPHLPGFVEYFETQSIRVSSVLCGPWNTFFVVNMPVT